jgi:hypothetical protein
MEQIMFEMRLPRCSIRKPIMDDHIMSKKDLLHIKIYHQKPIMQFKKCDTPHLTSPTPQIDNDQTAMGLLPVTSAVLLIAK